MRSTPFNDKTNPNQKLTALESELFGNMIMSERQQCRLGVNYPNEQHGTIAYYPKGDGDLIGDLTTLQSCLKGGMYGPEGKQTDVSFHVKEMKISHNSTEYTLIVHSTTNKENVLKVCSVSVFHRDRFIAYLFTTNDPLAFDNFNCYNGCASYNNKPELKSVEQLVFCEGKAAMNLKIVKPMTPESFYTEMSSNAFFNVDRVLKVLKATGNNPLDSPENNQEYESFKTSLDPDHDYDTKQAQLKKKLLSIYSKTFDEDHQVRFHNAYITYFEGKLQQDHDLLPFKHYKTVGRDVCAVGDFLTSFEKASLTYVLSARMRQLKISQCERMLASALVPSCVIECSKDDFLWAYILNEVTKKQELTDLIESSDWTRMFEMVHDATAFQDAFIEELSKHIDAGQHKEALNMLFYTDKDMKTFRTDHGIIAAKPKDHNAHRLGLSERLLQSLWTRQLIFPEELIIKISRELEKHGLTYVHYVPELSKSSRTALDIARSIGHSQ